MKTVGFCLFSFFAFNHFLFVLISSVGSLLPLVGSQQFPRQPHPGLQKVSQLARSLFVSLFVLHHLIFHISPYIFASKLLTCVLGRPVALLEVTAAYAVNMTCALYRTIYSVCMGSCRENTPSRARTHTRLPHAYGGLHPSAIPPKHRGRYVNWQMPTTALIPRPQDWSHSLTHSLRHTQLHAQLALGPGSDPWAFVEGAVYEYLQFNTTHPHKNSPAPERGWKWVCEKSADLSAGPKVISSTKKPKYAQLSLTLNFPFSWYIHCCSWHVN